MAKTVTNSAYRALLKRLVEARRAQGMTQEALAAKLGRPQSFVAKFEGGERRLDVIEFLRIAKLLKADYQTILKEVERLI